MTRTAWRAVSEQNMALSQTRARHIGQPRQADRMNAISYRNLHFPPSILQRAVWLHARFNVNLRDVEELYPERGVEVSYETIRRWVKRFGPRIAKRLRPGRRRFTGEWMVVGGGGSEPVSGAISLLNPYLQGKFTKKQGNCAYTSDIFTVFQSVTGEFPVQWNRELEHGNKECISWFREFPQRHGRRFKFQTRCGVFTRNGP